MTDLFPTFVQAQQATPSIIPENDDEELCVHECDKHTKQNINLTPILLIKESRTHENENTKKSLNNSLYKAHSVHSNFQEIKRKFHTSSYNLKSTKSCAKHLLNSNKIKGPGLDEFASFSTQSIKKYLSHSPLILNKKTKIS
jgi:hypothetical protein